MSHFTREELAVGDMLLYTNYSSHHTRTQFYAMLVCGFEFDDQLFIDVLAVLGELCSVNCSMKRRMYTATAFNHNNWTLIKCHRER